MAATQNTQLEGIANELKAHMDMVFKQAGLEYTKDPEVVERNIIEYDSRLRLFGMEKFNNPCYLSVINFYKSAQDQKNKSAVGAIVVYVEDECVERVLKAIGHPVKDFEDEENVFENMGAFCKDIVDGFKGQLSSKGYGSLIASDPMNYRNSASEGVEFNYDEYSMYELCFHFWKTKAVALDITFAPAN